MSCTLTVAVLDDNHDTVDMLCEALRWGGLTAFGGATSEPGFDTAAFVARHQPRVILYDVKHPYEQSVEKFRRLRRAAFSDLPVIITTTDSGHLERWLQKDEVIRVFMKPCELGGLTDTIRAAGQANL
jgi:CheY-like chemotaxis protein